MSDLRELYQEVVLDHSRSPRNFRPLPGATSEADGTNPLCGDRLHVWLAVEGDRVREVSFTGDGCAISKASASLMTQALRGKSKAEATALFEVFHRLVTGHALEDDAAQLGKLTVFGGVSEFPVRVKCASLAWHTFKAALDGTAAEVTTE
jgi:nitrogen fixation NifU-like protein